MDHADIFWLLNLLNQLKLGMKFFNGLWFQVFFHDERMVKDGNLMID